MCCVEEGGGGMLQNPGRIIDAHIYTQALDVQRHKRKMRLGQPCSENYSISVVRCYRYGVCFCGCFVSDFKQNILVVFVVVFLRLESGLFFQH